jgi:hypothetical protein
VIATVNLNKDESGFFLDVTLNAELNGVDADLLAQLWVRQMETANGAPEAQIFSDSGELAQLHGDLLVG